MKPIKQHILEKLKVSSESEYNFIGDFDTLAENILDISKSRVSNKNAFKAFVSDLETYFTSCCRYESTKYSTKHKIDNTNYNRDSLYFHQYYTSNEFELHYNAVTYHFKYTRSKLKMEKFKEPTYYQECEYRFSGFTSIIYVFPGEMIDNFNENIENF